MLGILKPSKASLVQYILLNVIYSLLFCIFPPWAKLRFGSFCWEKERVLPGVSFYWRKSSKPVLHTGYNEIFINTSIQTGYLLPGVIKTAHFSKKEQYGVIFQDAGIKKMLTWWILEGQKSQKYISNNYIAQVIQLKQGFRRLWGTSF